VNKAIRHVALILGLAFVALFAQLNVVQVARSRHYSEDPRNRRLLIREFATKRGQLVAGDEILARSIATHDRLKYLREYPLGKLFGPITGYYSFIFGRTGLERSYNRTLLGDEPVTPRDFFDDLIGRDRPGHTLILTVNPDLQRIARSKLGNQRGAVAAINPNTGAVLALYSNPSFDPNPLSGHDPAQVRQAWDRLNRDPLNPLIFRATQERYPPGSTFKIVTAAAGLELGKMTPDTTFPNPRALDLPYSDKTLPNFGGGACRGGGSRISFATGFRVSCNTTFGQVGLRIGGDKLAEMAGRFGLGTDLGSDLPTTPSCLRAASQPGRCDDTPLDQGLPGHGPFTALSAIGQFSVRVTPLQMAVVAATVANGGKVARPFVVRRVISADGDVLRETKPDLRGPIFSQRTASRLKKLMIDTVRFGTGAVVGFCCSGRVGGKTGTAQIGIEGKAPHAWFVTFAPGIAVAVVVENGGSLGSDATGGKVAGPIAKAIVERVLEQTGVKK
jgi:peptidoglycan glycosyltransferase